MVLQVLVEQNAKEVEFKNKRDLWMKLLAPV